MDNQKDNFIHNTVHRNRRKQIADDYFMTD